MPNYSVRNCLNENDIIVVEYKNILSPNQVVSTSPNVNCYSVITQVDQEPKTGIGGVYSNCLACYQQAGLYFLFINCKIQESPTYYISSSSFVTLPTLSKIYYMSIDGGNQLCYEFIGSSIEGSSSTITSEIVEYNQCEDCVVKPTFGELYNERVNDGNYIQKTNDFKNNYSNFINEREGQEPKR